MTEILTADDFPEPIARVKMRHWLFLQGVLTRAVWDISTRADENAAKSFSDLLAQVEEQIKKARNQ